MVGPELARDTRRKPHSPADGRGGQGPRAAPRALGPLARTAGVVLDAPLRGHLVRRYKRFLADVETEDGRTLTVHCPNPGSMLGLAVPGAAVRCSESASPSRKLRHTWEMVRRGRIWVGLHTGRANDVVARALARGALPGLAGRVEREVRTGSSRIDFRLRGSRDTWLEVKSVTLADGDWALFPDSVTERGRRHLETLMRLQRSGHRAVLLFLVQRADCRRVAPAEDIDPAYARTLRRAARRGVEVLALGARVTARSICVERRLPVVL